MAQGDNNLTLLAEKLMHSGIKFTVNEPMSRHTTFLVGGPAALFVIPATSQQIVLCQRLCRETGVALLPVGRGSNMLVDDEGLSMAVLHLGSGYAAITRLDERRLEVESGCKLWELCRRCAQWGLSGLETAYGIPGSLGGGIYMNAGAYGGEMKDVVRSVTFLEEDGELRTLFGDELEFRYRHSCFSHTGRIILSAVLELSPAPQREIEAAMDDYMTRRREKQPLEYGSAGSTFKRPEGAYAAALIDQCGLKGYTVGGAMVSEKHAGFVVNRGGATAAQVRAVMAHVAKTVLEKTGYRLEPEIMVLP